MSSPAKAPLIADAALALARLCRRYGVRRLELFGSAAVGRFDPQTSDLDFLVAFDEPAPGSTHADAYFGLHADLEALFARPIDLVTEAGLENPFFRQQLEKQKITVYDSSSPA